MSKNNNEEIKKDNKLFKHVVILIASIIVLLFIYLLCSNLINTNDENKNVSKVKKVLNEKYLDVKCVNKNCDYIVATSGNITKKTTYEIFNYNGKKIAKYIINYSKKTSPTYSEIIDATSKYFITKEQKNGEELTYNVRNKNGLSVYSTNKEVSSVNDELYSVKEDSMYSVYNYKGKKMYDNILSFKSYNNGKVVSIKGEKTNLITSYNNDIILSNYVVDREVLDDNYVKPVYLIVKDLDSNNKYYFSIKKNERTGNPFDSYIINNDYSILATKYNKKKSNSFIINKDGKINSKLTNDKKIFNNVKEEIDTDKYYVYSEGLSKNNKKYVFVDNKKEKSFGVLNKKNNKYKKLFEYDQNRLTIYSTLKELDENKKYVQISCSKYNCTDALSYIYDIKNNKLIYSSKDTDKIISKYVQYSDDYKVVLYSKSSNNEKVKGKYFVLDKNNKEIISSNSEIVIVDKKTEVGNISSSSLVLYSVKDKKFINSENTLAIKYNINDKIYYRYKNNKGKYVLIDNNSNKVLSFNSVNYLNRTNKGLVYVDDGRLYFFNSNNNKLRNYKLKNNEKMTTDSNDMIYPYRGVVFINNSNSKYFKVVNSKGRVIRNINNTTIKSVNINYKDNKAIIIVKKDNDKKDYYGFYVAK